MIKSLKIQNFQSHGKTELNFAPGVNVIVGSSDSGKTAIIRALRWVCWNRPSGDAIRSTWGGDTFVIVEMQEGCVWRFKGKEDKYELNLQDKAGITFKAFGTNVPQEIVAFLNINEINLQNQLDAPFLLSETSGAVATHFNKVARLDKIDSSTQKINADIRKLGSDIEYTEKDITTQTELLTKYEYLEKFEIDIEVLEELVSQASNKRNTIEQVRKLVRSIVKINTDIKELEVSPEYEALIDKLLGYYKEKDEKETTSQELSRLVKSIQKVETKVESYTLIISISSLVDKLIGLFAEVRQKRSDVKALNKINDTLYALKEQIVTSQENALVLEEQFHKEMPDICPLCDQPIKKK
jgi:exonuclease SbcC